MTEQISKTGPEAIEFDLEQLQQLASLHCTDEEIAAFFNVCSKTIQRRKKTNPEFLAAIEKGRAKGKLSLRRAQVNLANAGNSTMQIWLGKTILKQQNTFIKINLTRYKTAYSKIEKVIAEAAKGNISLENAQILVSLLRTLKDEEMIEALKRLEIIQASLQSE